MSADLNHIRECLERVIELDSMGFSATDEKLVVAVAELAACAPDILEHLKRLPTIPEDIEGAHYKVCWNEGHEGYDTLGETFGKAGDIVSSGQPVHIYPMVPRKFP